MSAGFWLSDRAGTVIEPFLPVAQDGQPVPCPIHPAHLSCGGATDRRCIFVNLRTLTRVELMYPSFPALCA